MLRITYRSSRLKFYKNKITTNNRILLTVKLHMMIIIFSTPAQDTIIMITHEVLTLNTFNSISSSSSPVVMRIIFTALHSIASCGICTVLYPPTTSLHCWNHQHWNNRRRRRRLFCSFSSFKRDYIQECAAIINNDPFRTPPLPRTPSPPPGQMLIC